MMQGQKRKKAAFVIVLLMILAVATTRGVTLMHNSYLHPDENVFVSAARSLKDRLMGIEDFYVEAKEYPEGAYVFQAPFHILAELFLRATGHKISGFISSRVASVTYFTFAAVIGCFMIFRWIDSRPAALGAYALIIVFSLMHLEQSRYGTGDAITMFLLITLILWCALACSGRQPVVFLLFAALFCGFAAAVKYPLAAFLWLPLIVLWRVFREKSLHLKIGVSLLLCGAALAGFFLCSPKAIFDPRYVLRVIRVESGAYLTRGNAFTLGGWYNHLLSILLYSMFYSGIPLAPALAVYAFVSRSKKRRGTHRTNIEFLFDLILPAAILLFIGYNVMVRSLFMRSCYPFFFFTDLYAAAAVSEFFYTEHRSRRALACVLATFMVCRGGWYIGALSERNAGRRLDSLILAARREKCESAELLATRPVHGPFLNYDKELLPDAEEIYIQDERFRASDTAELYPGEMVITCSEDHSRCNRYIIPYEDDAVHELIFNWETFKHANAQYYVGQAYPEYYYYLFGFWIKGTTGTDYEFPTNQVYYRAE